MLGEVCAGSGCRDSPVGESERPLFRAGREREPGASIRLDHIRRSASGVPRSLDRLHRPERRNSHLDRIARRLLRQQLQEVTHRRRRHIATRRSRHRGTDAREPDVIRNPRPSHVLTVARCR
jgi:hypothetical protein